MLSEQETHLSVIKANFEKLVDAKYRKGQAEHGGNLWSMGVISLVDCALDEAIDQVVYLITLRHELEYLLRLNNISQFAGDKNNEYRNPKQPT